MTAQDSQSELDKLIESWIPINVKDKDFVKEAKMKGRKDFNEAIEAYVITRVKEAERLARIVEAESFYSNVSGMAAAYQESGHDMNYEMCMASLLKDRIKDLTTTTNGTHDFFPIDGFLPSKCKCGLLESEHKTTNGKEE